jgi:hypothetical protein
MHVSWHAPIETGSNRNEADSSVVASAILRQWKFYPVDVCYAHNTGTAYFFFSGVTDFGDWAAVILGLYPHCLWRALLVIMGASSYYAAVLVVGIGLVRYVGIPREQQEWLRKLAIVPYFSAILVASAAGLLNRLGIQLLWQSALPATAGGQSGLLWLQYYIPRGTEPRGMPQQLGRSYLWVCVLAVLGLVYAVVLGRGITLHSWRQSVGHHTRSDVWRKCKQVTPCKCPRWQEQDSAACTDWEIEDKINEKTCRNEEDGCSLFSHPPSNLTEGPACSTHHHSFSHCYLLPF